MILEIAPKYMGLVRLLVLIGVVVVVAIISYIREMLEELKREMDEDENLEDFANNTPPVNANSQVNESFFNDGDDTLITNDY